MKVQIFLASSINEFAQDRLKIGDFINRLNKIYHTKNIFFALEKCEDVDEAIFKGGKQEQYDEIIRVSDIMFLLFGEKVGEWTRHEFDVAYETFKKINKPQIVVYLRTATDNGSEITQDDSAVAFKKYLNDELKHFWGKYCHVDTLLFKIVMHIIAANFEGVNINVSDGIVKDGDNDILSLQNVPAWCNNQVLLEIEERITKTSEELATAKANFVDDADNDEKFEELKKLRETLTAMHEDLRNKREQVFNTLLFCTERLLSGEYSKRLYEANRLLEDGKWSEAIILLKETKNDIAEIFNDVDVAETLEDLSMRLKADAKNKAKIAFDEQLLLIKLMSAKAEGVDGWHDVQNEYERTIELVKKFDLDKSIIGDYARFLKEQLYYEKAIPHMVYYLGCLNANKADKLTMAVAHCDLAEILVKAGKYLTGTEDYVDTFGLAFSMIDKVVGNDLTASDYAKIAKCYLSLGRYWGHSHIAELRNATEFEHGIWLLNLSRTVWNKISQKKDIVWERIMTNALKLHWQVINEIGRCGTPHREMASTGLLSNEAIVIANLLFFTAGVLGRQSNKESFIGDYHYDSGECEFELGNIYANDNKEFDTADYFYQNALMRFSQFRNDDEILKRYCHRFRGIILMNLYACWINKHRHGQSETGKQWSDFDIACGKSSKWTCEELAMHYLYNAHGLFNYLYPLNPNQYASGLASAYMMAADREKSIGNYDKAEDFYKRVVKVHDELPQDIDSHSSINKDKIEALTDLARLYMRPDNFKPEIAVNYYNQASEFCLKLSENKFMFFIPTQIKTYIDSTTAFAAVGNYEKAFDILFNKAFQLMITLFSVDHFMKFSCWDWWLDKMSMFRHTLIGLVRAGECQEEILTEFITRAVEAFECVWVNEVTQVGTTKLDLLISDSLRGVNKKGFEDYVVDTIDNGIHTTVVARAAIEEAGYLSIADVDSPRTSNIVQGRIGYFEGLLKRIDEEKDGYLYLVISRDIKMLSECLASIC